MLEKTARKPSSDPAQEKLRQDKATWNKDVSSFINDVIHLKKTMNGWPSKFYKERSRITQPIPADPNTILGSLANDFQELAQRGESIVSEQLNYSKNRRQKQPKPVAPTAQAPQVPQAPAAPAAPEASQQPAQPDLSKQLAAFEQKYGDGLVAEGSNKGTRALTRLLNMPGKIPFWTSGAKKRRHRMNMLKRAADVYKLLGKLQVKIIAPFSSKQSIKDSYEFIRGVKTQWGLIGETLESYAKVAGPELSPEETGKQLAADKEEKKSLEEAKKTVEEAKKTDKAENKAEQVIEQAKEEKAEQGQQAPAAPPSQMAPPPPQNSINAPAPQVSDFDVVPLTVMMVKDYKANIGGALYNPLLFGGLSQAINAFVQVPGNMKNPKIDAGKVVMNEYAKVMSTLNAQYGTNATTIKGVEQELATKQQSEAAAREAERQAKQQAAPPGVNFPKEEVSKLLIR